MGITSRRGFAVLSVLVSTFLGFSSCFLGIYALTKGLEHRISTWQREIRGQYTTDPTEPYLGTNPGRDERRGVWTTEQIKAAKAANELERAQADTNGGYYIISHTYSVENNPGNPFPWEGSSSAGGGDTNTGNGNHLISLPLFKWKMRGGMTLDITLYNNNETSYEDELGKGWTWSYDLYINNLTTSPTMHWGNGLAIPYTHSGSTYTPPAGIYDQLVKNTDGTWTLTTKDKIVYSFNTDGFCTAITDRNGNQINFTLNSGNYVTQISDSTGRTVSINLNSSMKWTSITDNQLSRTWSFSYDGSDDMTTVTWPSIGDGHTYTDGFSYSAGVVTYQTDRRGNTWHYTYNLSHSFQSSTDPNGYETDYGYTSSTCKIYDPLSNMQEDFYSSGIQTSHEDESSYTENYVTRDSNYNVTKQEDQNGNYWNYTYDSNGNMLTAKDPLSHTKTWTYNSFNEPLTYEDALGHTETYTYDSHGNELTDTNALSITTKTNTWDSYGQLSTSTDALTNTTTYTYSSNGDLASVKDPLLNTTTFGYDSVSRLTSTTDPYSNTESITYDNWDRPTKVTHPDSTTIVKAYNAIGELTSVTDENSHTTSYTYDSAGRKTGMSTPNSETESYGYDNANRLTSVTNGRGYTRNYTYTARSEVATLTMPDTAEEQWSYDGNGHTTAYENPLSQTIDYTYDAAGRETGINYPTGTDPTFSYDNADRRTGMTDATGTTTWGYDNANQLTSLSTPEGNLTYTLDNDGRQTAMTEPAGSWSYSYDADSHLTSETNPSLETTTWTFDADGRRTGQTFANGQIDVYGYDSRSRMTSLTHENSSSATISAETYTWDNAGNLTAKTIDSNSWSYGYDNDDQLTSETAPTYSASYTYDANGNRASYTTGGVTQTYNVDHGDKLTSITSGGTTIKSYGYDAAGRTTSVTSSAGTTTLSYDYEDRVTGITYPSSATNSFTYNALDTRVAMTDTTGTYHYVRNGAGVTSPILEDGTATYTPGVSQHRGTSTTFDNNDYLGTANRQTDATQSTSGTRSYDAFGNLVSTTGSPVGPFGFVEKAGYQEDGDSGLKLLGHRYYDPSTGRFLTRDPSRDTRNWYIYGSANPLRNIDPDGLQNKKAIVLLGDVQWYLSPHQSIIFNRVKKILAARHYDYTVLEGGKVSEDAVWNKLKLADGFIYIGHGLSDDSSAPDNGEPTPVIDGDDPYVLDEGFVDYLQKSRGGQKLDFVWLISCYSGFQGRIWQNVAHSTYTYHGGVNIWRQFFPQGWKEKGWTPPSNWPGGDFPG